MDCPFCAGGFSYTVFTNTSGPTLFFYSDRHNDILLRQSDLKRVATECPAHDDAADALEMLWRDILSQAPEPARGGRFTLWANVKCPLCGVEFPYGNGLRDTAQRLHEPKIIVPDGAILMTDDGCTRVKVKAPLKCNKRPFRAPLIMAASFAAVNRMSAFDPKRTS